MDQDQMVVRCPDVTVLGSVDHFRQSRRVTCSADITLDTLGGDVLDAIERGDVKFSDMVAVRSRLDREVEARRVGALRAAELVRAADRARRRSRWTTRCIFGGDGVRRYLVQCGRVAWHVDPETWEIQRVPTYPSRSGAAQRGQ
jgi:hypothetical protein